MRAGGVPMKRAPRARCPASCCFRTKRLCSEDMWNRRELLQTAIASSATGAMLYGEPHVDRPADLTRLSLRDAGVLVRRKAVSPVELTEACLSRIERLNPQLNAFI